MYWGLAYVSEGIFTMCMYNIAVASLYPRDWGVTDGESVVVVAALSRADKDGQTTYIVSVGVTGENLPSVGFDKTSWTNDRVALILSKLFY